MGRTAMILAAGRGERLRPLTDELAKPALPLLGRALLLRTVDRLVAGGVDRLAVNLHHRPGSLRSLLDPPPAGIDQLHLSLEEEVLLGTGGGARRALPFLSQGDDAVVLLNGDSHADLDLDAAFAAHRQGAASVTLVLTEGDTGRYGAVREQGGLVTGFDRLGSGPPTGGRPLVFCGIQIIDPTLLERLPADRPSDLVRDLYQPMLEAGEPLGALVHPDCWIEVGEPRLYRDAVLRLARSADATGRTWIGPGPAPAHRDAGILLAAPGAGTAPGVRITGVVVMEPGTRAMDGAFLEDAVLLEGAMVGSMARVVRSVVGPGARVPPGALLTEVLAVRDTGPSTEASAEPPRPPGLRMLDLSRGETR